MILWKTCSQFQKYNVYSVQNKKTSFRLGWGIWAMPKKSFFFMGRTSLKSLDFSTNCSWWRVKCLVLRAHGSNFWMHELTNNFGGIKFLKRLPCLIFMIDYRASQKSAHLRIFFNPGLGAKNHDKLSTWFADISQNRQIKQERYEKWGIKDLKLLKQFLAV